MGQGLRSNARLRSNAIEALPQVLRKVFKHKHNIKHLKSYDNECMVVSSFSAFSPQYSLNSSYKT